MSVIEEWREVRNTNGFYQASNTGKIKSVSRFYESCVGVMLKPESILKAKVTTNGYPFVTLSVNGKKKTRTVHRMIAEEFIPNPKLLGDVNHKNGIKTDNRAENLEWCDRQRNIKHAYYNGLRISRKGEEVFWKAKLTEDQVRAIFNDHRIASVIAKEYGVTKSCITHIKSGISWKHLGLCA